MPLDSLGVASANTPICSAPPKVSHNLNLTPVDLGPVYSPASLI